MKNHIWNKKVAQNRGETWRKKLLSGRLMAQMSPSKLRLFRIEKELTQEEVASAVGLSPSTYMAIESGKRPAKMESAEKIANYLDISLKKAFTDSSTKNRFEVIR